ncbi:MAG: sensor histidine kinase, partial [Acidobacteria bacterium]|nr:sensor histidine kinase [Acidobacteriota bacterium]
LRQLSRQLVQAQEEERKAISRELHDEVGQMLTALRMDLGGLERMGAASASGFEERLASTKRLTEDTLRAVRDLSLGLRPSMLDDLGLGPALEWQAREFSRRSGTPVNVRLEGNLAGLPEAHRTCVFRVVQEALTNCARHAEARDIRVGVHGHADSLFVTVEDDGAGMPEGDAHGRGIGLIGIQERVRQLGGSLEIFSQPGRGTTLKVTLPVKLEVGT